MMKKKMIAGALCVLLLCSVLVGCSGQSEGTQSYPEYTVGTRTSTTFTSEWMKLTYTLTDDMVMETDDQIAQLTQAGNEQVTYEAVASNSNGSSIVIVAEKLSSSSMDENQYLSSAKKQLQNSKNYEITFEETGKQTVAGQEFVTLPYAVTVNNNGTKMTITQTILCKKQGDRMICVTLTYPDKDNYEKMLAGFSAL